jgi:quinol monooxygenase YgiN
MNMIMVIASIRIKPGTRADYLPILKALVPDVGKEEGCIEYLPAVDLDTKMPVQALDKDVVTILEKWESLEALQNHLGSAHMLEYRERVKNLVENVSVRVLQEA